MIKQYEALPWKIEAFGNFRTYEVLQQAASVICLYENIDIFKSSIHMKQFQEELNKRTGLDWTPNRQVADSILFNSEGDLFRNKARLLTSFFLLDPRNLKNKVFQPTSFCKALGYGMISENEFYQTIIKRFQYPNPAYEDDCDVWLESGIVLKPFIFIIQILVELFKIDATHSYITTNEFALLAHPFPFHNNVKNIADSIIKYREEGVSTSRVKTDQIDRKITDLFSFLCLSGITFYRTSNQGIQLNVIKKHPEKKYFFYLRKEGCDILDDLHLLINSSLAPKDTNGI